MLFYEQSRHISHSAAQLPPIYCRLRDMSCLAKVKSVFSVKLATSAALKSNFQFPHYDSISI
jgi:hypothetical protein